MKAIELKNKVTVDFKSTVKKQRIAKFVEIAKALNFNLLSLAKENPYIKIQYNEFLEGNFENLYLIFTDPFNTQKWMSEEKFLNTFFTSPFDGEYVGFPNSELC